MGKHLVMIAIILVMLFIPVMAFSMMLGYLKSNLDMVCNYKASLSIIFGSNVEETLKIACAPEGVASGVYGGGGNSCSGTDLIPADKRDQYMTWVKEAAGIYLDGNEPLLISLISTESEWQNIPNKKGSGALGLGQFMKTTAEGLREFTGGDNKNTSIRWEIGNLNGGTGDARYDPKRSIYAAAHLFRDRKKSTNYVIPKCGTTDTGIDYYICVYGWGYNTGLTGSDPGVYAAMDRMKNAYNNLTSSGTCTQNLSAGLGGSIYELAEKTVYDVSKLDGGSKNRNMSITNSIYSKTPSKVSYCLPTKKCKESASCMSYAGAMPWWADCANFTGYVVSRSSDKNYPFNGQVVQFEYLTGKKYLSSSAYYNSDNRQPENVVSTKGKKYYIFVAKNSNEMQPGDILFNKKADHTTIYAGGGMQFAASRCGHGPEKQNWSSTMNVVARFMDTPDT